jgi:hypothetical protein
MLLDYVLRTIFRNFWTIFFFLTVFTVPLHLGYSVVFSEAIETREIHNEIESFPSERQVRGVGRDEVFAYRATAWLLVLLELAALPLLARGARRIVELDANEEVATVRDALEHLGDRLGPSAWRAGGFRVFLLVAGIGITIGFLVDRIAFLLLEFIPDDRTFPFFGLVRAISHATVLTFLVVALHRLRSAKEGAPTVPKLY